MAGYHKRGRRIAVSRQFGDMAKDNCEYQHEKCSNERPKRSENCLLIANCEIKPCAHLEQFAISPKIQQCRPGRLASMITKSLVSRNITTVSLSFCGAGTHSVTASCLVLSSWPYWPHQAVCAVNTTTGRQRSLAPAPDGRCAHLDGTNGQRVHRTALSEHEDVDRQPELHSPPNRL
jgi:hypothetical protein